MVPATGVPVFSWPDPAEPFLWGGGVEADSLDLELEAKERPEKVNTEPFT